MNEDIIKYIFSRSLVGNIYKICRETTNKSKKGGQKSYLF